MEQRPPCRRLRRSEPVPMTAQRSDIEGGYCQGELKNRYSKQTVAGC
jgi:hypothetical protein